MLGIPSAENSTKGTALDIWEAAPIQDYAAYVKKQTALDVSAQSVLDVMAELT